MITFYVDGGKKNGMGHIYRSINLALVLKKKVKTNFLIPGKKTINEKKILINIFKKFNFKLRFINKNFDTQFKNQGNQCIIFDHPKINIKTIKIAKKKFKQTILIDDENFLNKYETDMIINQNAYAKKLNYKIKKNKVKKLFGSQYTILKSHPNIKIKIKKNLRNILLIFGGTDVRNYYKKITKKIPNFKLVIMASNKIILKKITKIKKIPNVEIINTNNIFQVIKNKKIDLAISCCGTTLYDLFSYGVPVVGMLCANNQINAYNFYSKNKAIIASSPSMIKSNLNQLNFKKRLKLVKNSIKFYNYNGKFIVARKILKMINTNDKKI
jgi:UDP-2,4-diacetamido-2,4,6-trideoxy-beta-L-altropyranose hydrolase